MNAAFPIRPNARRRVRALGDASNGLPQIDPGFGSSPIGIGTVLPWVFVIAVAAYAIGSRKNRPRKKRKKASQPIVVGKGMGALAALGLLGLGGLVFYGISQASAAGGQ